MNITRLIKEAHDNAVEKGFYDCPICEGKESLMPDNGREKCSCWETAGIDPNRNIGELLMLIVSELGEALEAHRNNNLYRYSKPLEIINCFEYEIADVFIRLADLCGYLNIDIEKHIEAKMAYNKTRQRKHGKEY